MRKKDDEELVPMGSFWPAPEDEKWTMVERSHRSLCGTANIDSDRLHKSGYQLDHSGMRCGQLDNIEETDNRGTRPEVPLKFWTIMRRPNGNCPRNCWKYHSSQSREGFWNWPRRPGKLVWKRSSLFLWKKFHHR